MKPVVLLLVLASIIIMVFLVREYVIGKWYKRTGEMEDTSLPRTLDEVGMIIKVGDNHEYYGENSIICVPKGQSVPLNQVT